MWWPAASGGGVTLTLRLCSFGFNTLVVARMTVAEQRALSQAQDSIRRRDEIAAGKAAVALPPDQRQAAIEALPVPGQEVLRRPPDTSECVASVLGLLMLDVGQEAVEHGDEEAAEHAVRVLREVAPQYLRSQFRVALARRRHAALPARRGSRRRHRGHGRVHRRSVSARGSPRPSASCSSRGGA